MKRLKITLKKSLIDEWERHKRTVLALGLRKIRQTKIHKDTPQIRGMIEKVKHLLLVEEINE